MAAERYVLGVDVGGTFTDLVLIRLSDGRAFFHKTSSTPADPSIAVADGVEVLLAQSGVAARDVQYFGHGTTVEVNGGKNQSLARSSFRMATRLRNASGVRISSESCGCSSSAEESQACVRYVIGIRVD